MAIIGQEIAGYAINQINARQVLHGSGKSSNRNTDQISVLNANSSWVSLASGVSISRSKLTELGLSTSLEGMGLAKANVLFAGTSKSSTQGLKQKDGFLGDHRNSSYTYGDYGYSPMPGITSVDVKTLNRGSLKKATVKIKINNRQQFDIIEALYLRLGYTVLLEWGNSLYTTTGHNKLLVEGTLVENTFFNSAFGSNRSYRDILTPIAQYRYKYNGNYDALLGKISNFNWSFNPDGSYDAEITIISLGDVIESLKLNIPTNKQLNAFILKASGDATQTTTDIPVSDTGTTTTASTIITAGTSAAAAASTAAAAKSTTVSGNQQLATVLKDAGYTPGTFIYEWALIQGTIEGYGPAKNIATRQNNPGNLRGANYPNLDPGATKVGGFAKFSTKELGAKAMVQFFLIKWSNGDYPGTLTNGPGDASKAYRLKYKVPASLDIAGKKINVNAEQFYYIYAPPSDGNDTELYINNVVNSLKKKFPGFTRNEKLINWINK